MGAAAQKPVKIFLVAGEASGDMLAAELVEPLRAAFGDSVAFAGIGGAAMAGQGISSPVALSQLSVLGYIEGLMAWWRISRLARETAHHAIAFDADIVVLVDSWGFTLRVARALRKLRPHVLLVKYVGPQVWASRAGRAKTLATSVDHLLAMHAFDAPYYENTGLDVTFVGNPVLSRPLKGDGNQLKNALHLPAGAKILLLLFGSRKAEFARLHRPFVDAARLLCVRDPKLVVIAPLSAAIATQVRAAAAVDPDLQDIIFVDEAQKADAFAAADVALACSGTVTTELAQAGIPMVVGYKLGILSWFLLKTFFLKTPFVTLVNVAAGSMIVPEFLQMQCRADNLAGALEHLLCDTAAYTMQRRCLLDAVKSMRADGAPAAQKAASTIKTLWLERCGSGAAQRASRGT